MDKKIIAEELINNISCKNFRTLTSSLEDGSKGIYIVLKIIANMNKEVIASDIADALGVSIARITVALKTLESKKLIVKTKSLKDKRKTIVSITDLGYKELRERNKKLISIVHSLLNKLTIEESEQLLNISKKINH